MKQCFLNQKLGKRTSRRAEINKAKRLLNKAQQLLPRKKASGRLRSHLEPGEPNRPLTRHGYAR
jgi:hypothetical protein